MTFADHLQQVFTPHHFLKPAGAAISAFLDVTCQISLLIQPFSTKELLEALVHTNVRKAPVYDLISGKVLKELPKKAITRSLFFTTAFFASPIIHCYGNLHKL